MERIDSELLKSWEQASWMYHRQLSQKGLSYLTGRGINSNSVETFRLGEVVDPLPGHEMMVGRICIPYIKKLATVALKFRCTQDHQCKDAGCVKYLSDGKQWLYGTADIDLPSPAIGIGEGEFDKIILSQIGIPSVGVPGVESWKSHAWWTEVLKGHRRVLVFADNDASNEKNPGFRLGREIMKDLPRARLVVLPDDHDVTSTYLEFSPEELYKRSGWER